MASVSGVATGNKVASHSVWFFEHSIPHHGGGSRVQHGGAQANPFCILNGDEAGLRVLLW